MDKMVFQVRLERQDKTEEVVSKEHQEILGEMAIQD